MQSNNTLLQQIDISDEVVQAWKKKGLKITFPMKANDNYFESEDGDVFVGSADRYVPLLNNQDTKDYIENPDKFSQDFLTNVRFYFDFHTFLFDQSLKLDNLNKPEDKLASALALAYLFLSAMDHHYYHFDRYLVYQNYPETPVGFWWQKLKDYYFKAYNEPVTNNNFPIKFLKLLGREEDVIKEIKANITDTEIPDFNETLRVIKLFEDTQQKEAEIVTGYPSPEDLLLRTGFGLWNNLSELIKANTNLIKSESKEEVLDLLQGHPIVSTRELLLEPQLNKFVDAVVNQFKKEIERWI